MSSNEEPVTPLAFTRGITPRRPIRRGMNLPQTVAAEDLTKEGKVSYQSRPIVWEQVASWSRYYLHIPPTAKIVYYITSLFLFSFIHSYYTDLPHFESLTGKYSILNQIFAKQAWGITLGVFFLYHIISLWLSPKLMVGVVQLIIRSLSTTFFFFIWCQVVFPAIDNLTSTCVAGNQTFSLARKECLSVEGRQYFSFDISGHLFLLTFCILTLMEESKEILYFLWLGRRLYGEGTQERSKDFTWPELSEKEMECLRRRYPKLAPFVVLAFLCMTALGLLWDFMIVVTTLYYHTFAEKVTATALVLFTYVFLYRAAFPWLFKITCIS